MRPTGNARWRGPDKLADWREQCNDFFSPTPNTVPAGAVTFRWATPSTGHTLTWDSGPGTLPANTGVITSATQVVTLQAGTYQYHCAIHGGPGTGMHGTSIAQ